MLPRAVTERLIDLPLTTVSASTTELRKSFHSKVFTLFASGQAEMSVYQGVPRFSHNFIHQRGDQADYTIDTPSAIAVRDWLLADARAGGEQIRRLRSAWQPDWERFLRAAEAYRSTDFRQLSDAELLDRTDELYDAYVRAGNAAYLIDALITAGDSDPVEALAFEALTTHGFSDEKARELLPHLISPLDRAYSAVAKEERFRLAAGIEAEFGAVQFEQLSPALRSGISDYAQRWWWLENNYFHALVLSTQDIFAQLRDLVATVQAAGRTIRAELDHDEALARESSKQREAAERQLPDDDALHQLFATIHLWGSWKDLRKSGVQIGMGLFELLLTDVARRLDWPLADVGHLVFPELRAALIDRVPMAAVIAARKQQVFYANSDHGYFIVEGTAAQPYFDARVADAHSNELIGKSASPGTVRGRARVILHTVAMHDFIDGEILIANQTTPEFMPIMRKAAAIVTEQGGITSHAAVISRELGVPCVIGTRVATKVFATGDLIDVDATNGIVRKVD